MGRRILNRKDLRADFEAAERRGKEGEEDELDEEESEDEDEDADTEEEAGQQEEGDEPEEETKTRTKHKVKEPKPKPKPKPRTRTPKIIRMKVVWGVFNNSHQKVAVYDYARRKDADDHAAKLTADKKSTHFVQPIKEPMEEKKE